MDPPLLSVQEGGKGDEAKGEGCRVVALRVAVLMTQAVSIVVNQVIWLSFAPVAGSTGMALDEEAHGINMFSLMYMIGFIPGVAAFSLIMQAWGLKGGMLTGAALDMGGTWIKWAAWEALRARAQGDGAGLSPSSAFALALFGQLLPALAQPVFTNSPARVAAEWFPPSQRELATTVGTVAQFLGLGLGQVIPGVTVTSLCTTSFADRATSHEWHAQGTCTSFVTEMWWMLLGHAVVATLVTLATAALPAKPAVPPSAGSAQRDELRAELITSIRSARSASAMSAVDETPPPPVPSPHEHNWAGALAAVHDLGEEWWYIAQNAELWKAIIGFGVGLGALNTILTLLEQILAPCGLGPHASMIGGIMIGVGVVGAFAGGIGLEMTKSHTLVMRIAGAGVVIASLGVIFFNTPSHTALLIASYAVLGFFVSPILPVSLEGVAEHTYPIPEEASAAFLLGAGQIFGLAFVPAATLLIPPVRHVPGHDQEVEVNPRCGTFDYHAFLLLFPAMVVAAVFLSWFQPKTLRSDAEARAKADAEAESAAAKTPA